MEDKLNFKKVIDNKNLVAKTTYKCINEMD
jgi:hypothetical protein